MYVGYCANCGDEWIARAVMENTNEYLWAFNSSCDGFLKGCREQFHRSDFINDDNICGINRAQDSPNANMVKVMEVNPVFSDRWS